MARLGDGGSGEGRPVESGGDDRATGRDRLGGSAAFRALGHGTVDALADHLEALRSGAVHVPVLPWVPPNDAAKRWFLELRRRLDSLASSGRSATVDDALGLFRTVIAESHHLHHACYVGHQVTAPLPSAAVSALVSALLNNGSAVYEMGPVSIAMERAVLRYMADKVGFDPQACDGVLTSGGSAGNLTALLAARQAMAGFDVWNEGAHRGPPLAVLVSDQAHYSVERSLRILGWGAEGVVKVESDERYRMRPDALESALARARASGRRTIAVVGSACSTATGAIDPLAYLADFAERNGLWFHVDGAHGASFVLSPRLRPRFSGIERAHSVVWDAHKMLRVPALVTAVLFRDGRHSCGAFSQDASYLFASDGRGPDAAAQLACERWFDVGQRTIECTKNMMGFVLYAALALHGEAYFASYLEQQVDLASAFADLLERTPDFELAVRPEANIVCFRYVGDGSGGTHRSDAVRLDELQSAVRHAIIESGAYYLVETTLRGRRYLRTTLIEPHTTLGHLEGLLEAVRSQAGRARTRA